MEAKDTVMKTVDELRQYHFTERSEVGDMDAPIVINEDCWDIPALLEAQAEISFKAGREDEKTHWISEIERQVKDAYEGGIREVVERVEKLNLLLLRFDADGKSYTEIPLKDTDEWQAKLKDWDYPVK